VTDIIPGWLWGALVAWAITALWPNKKETYPPILAGTIRYPSRDVTLFAVGAQRPPPEDHFERAFPGEDRPE
jgi:hypothetical protein